MNPLTITETEAENNKKNGNLTETEKLRKNCIWKIRIFRFWLSVFALQFQIQFTNGLTPMRFWANLPDQRSHPNAFL